MQKHEQAKFENGYNKYADMLYRIALSYLKNADDAEDVVHDTFLKYIRHLFRFRDEGHERAWLIRVTLNRCKDLLKYRRTCPLEEAMEVAAPEKEDSILFAVHSLEEPYRLPIVFHYLEGFSVEETAALLDLSLSATKMRLSRARQLLKTILEKENRDV